MSPKSFALVGGLIMLVVGVVSLIPNMVGSQMDLPVLLLNESYGNFLGFFPMNIVNKVALVLFGLAGIAVSRLDGNALPRSILWSRIVFVVMGLCALLGIIPQTNTFFGYWPLFGGDALLHAVFAGLGAYYGFALSRKVHHEIKTDPNLRATFQNP